MLLPRLPLAIDTRRVESFDGTAIAYHVTPEPFAGAPWVILANGLGGTYVAWRGLIDYLKPRYRFLTWDYRGLYASQRPSPDTQAAYAIPAHVRDLQAILAAERIEAEIDAINAIAEDHDQMLGHTVFKDPMPRLVREPYAEVVAQIASHAPGVAQMEFDRVIAACDDLIHRELGMLRDRVHNGVHSHSARTKSYVHEAWMQLHGHALAHSVDMAYLEEVVTSTERAFAAEVATNGGARTNVAVTA